ncbi:hypothetical protein EHP00_1848 [Ecytonucleospora hepatopenaei]|uniref:Uncharacterized protein n=1 Tax=Ecytonucleospora hepatopenaei TaxID=646526 RepID=A0A1W0E4R6_9MICR|nr:hypothetical protein EHP00_1848 [Ecytonucleospora hepatopenaei]
MTKNKITEEKLKIAAKLKEKHGGFFGIGASADFVGAGIIYEELAENSTDSSEKEKFFTMAAETFEMDKSEYALWRSSECYRELFELSIKDDREKATEFQVMGCDKLKIIKKWNIAGQRYVTLGELFEIDRPEKALEFYQEAVECYSKVPSYKANLKIVKLKVLLCLIILKKLDQIINMMEEENLFEKQEICMQLCLILKGSYKEIDESDLKNKEEKELIDAILNGEKEEYEEKMKEYQGDTHLNVYAQCIFDMFLESYALESELC